MAALSGITAVRPTANTNVERVQYGATVSAGQPTYSDAADSNKNKLASNAAAATGTVRGIAVTPGVSNGFGYVATSGAIILVGTTMTVGETYYVGAAGQIIPDADLTTGNYVSRLGTASSATQLDLSIANTGIVHA